MAGDLVDVGQVRAVPAWTLIDQLVEHVRPALHDRGDEDTVTNTLARIRERGTGASRQRAAYARRNALADVIADAVERTVGPAYSRDRG